MSGGPNILRLGPIAADILHHDGDAEVVAVFERSAVVMTTHGFVTLGDMRLGDGPLNVLLAEDMGPVAWLKFGLARDVKGAVVHGTLALGKDFRVDCREADLWSPPLWANPTRSSVSANLDAIRATDRVFWPAEGVSRIVVLGSSAGADRTALAAAPTVMSLRDALTEALRNGQLNEALVRTATLMIGLGPGLTPSGDDLLGGIFLTLSALGETGLRDALWDKLANEMDALTTGLSGAHVAAAADGMASAAYHAALNTLLAHPNDAALSEHLRTLQGIGHSSGLDTLAGMVLTLDACLAANAISQ